MQAADGQLVIIVLVAGLETARDQSEGAGVLGEAELGGFVEDAEFLERRLLGHQVAEGHAVIVGACIHHQAPAAGGRLHGLDGDGVVVVAYGIGLALHRGPCLILAGRLRRFDPDGGAECGRTLDGETEVRPLEHGPAMKSHPIGQLATGRLDGLALYGGDGNLEGPVRRGEHHRSGLRRCR